MNMTDFNLNTKPKIKSGFKVPKKYFEEFETKIMVQLPEREGKIIPLFKRNRILITTIAAILIAVISIPFYFNLSNRNILEEATLESYLITQFSTYDMIDRLSFDDISALENSLALNEDDLEAYLLNSQNLDFYLND
jgi:hypothetical protein